MLLNAEGVTSVWKRLLLGSPPDTLLAKFVRGLIVVIDSGTKSDPAYGLRRLALFYANMARCFRSGAARHPVPVIGFTSPGPRKAHRRRVHT
jgi:hypothetical protein